MVSDLLSLVPRTSRDPFRKTLDVSFKEGPEKVEDRLTIVGNSKSPNVDGGKLGVGVKSAPQEGRVRTPKGTVKGEEYSCGRENLMPVGLLK